MSLKVWFLESDLRKLPEWLKIEHSQYSSFTGVNSILTGELRDSRWMSSIQGKFATGSIKFWNRHDRRRQVPFVRIDYLGRKSLLLVPDGKMDAGYYMRKEIQVPAVRVNLLPVAYQDFIYGVFATYHGGNLPRFADRRDGLMLYCNTQRACNDQLTL